MALKNNKTKSFYVAWFVAALSLITGVIYMTTMQHLTDSFSWIAVALLIASLPVFALFVLIKKSRMGIALVAGAAFAALILMLIAVAPYIVEVVSENSMTGFSLDLIPELPAVIGCAVLMLLCAIIGNVLAWCKLEKDKKLKKGDKGKKQNGGKAKK